MENLHNEYIMEKEGAKSVLLCVHGILGTPNFFNSFVQKLPKEWSVYNLLLDGHGKKVKDFSQSSMEKWKAQVHSVVEELSDKYDKIMIAAHSMGTLFAIDESIKNKDKVKCLFLIDCPLSVKIKPTASVNSLRVIFKVVDQNSDVALAVRDAYSIEPSKKLWNYSLWIPRYLELFREIYTTRSKVKDITTDTFVFQSQKDELVSLGACRFFVENKNIKLSVLKSSGHFYFPPQDMNYLIKAFWFACQRVDKL